MEGAEALDLSELLVFSSRRDKCLWYFGHGVTLLSGASLISYSVVLGLCIRSSLKE